MSQPVLPGSEPFRRGRSQRCPALSASVRLCGMDKDAAYYREFDGNAGREKAGFRAPTSSSELAFHLSSGAGLPQVFVMSGNTFFVTAC